MQKLLNIDRRIVFLGVALVLFLGLVLRPVIPLPPSSEARKVFDAVEAVEAGQAILIAMDYGVSSRAELDPMSRAALHHAFNRGARVLCVSFDSSGAPLAARACRSWENERRGNATPCQSSSPWRPRRCLPRRRRRRCQRVQRGQR